MNEKTYTVELTRHELRALGVAVAAFVHGHRLEVVLAIAAEDLEVLHAYIDSAAIKMSYIEDLIDPDTHPSGPQFEEARTRLQADVDQRFARLREEGRL